MSEPRAPFVYLASPCYGGVINLYFAKSLLALQAAAREQGVGLHVDLMGGDALITRARARLVAGFLAHPQATHICFIDADIGFQPSNVFRLLEAKKDMVAAVCPLKTIDWELVRAAAKADVADIQAASINYVVRFIPTPDQSVEVEDGFAKVAYGGTGFLMISRSAIERIVAANPQLMARLDGPDGPETPMLFETMVEPETGQYLSEDYAFCRRWSELGGEVWADFHARLAHVGHAAYTGSLIQRLRPG